MLPEEKYIHNLLSDFKMKKKYWVLICTVAFLFIAIITVIHMSNSRYNITGNIESVKVESSIDNIIDGPKETSDEKKISVLLNCIKNVKLNNKYRIKNRETAPIFYKITITFTDGKNKIYEYKVYPSTEYNDPFAEFYELFSK
jgi:hypothetical protein